MKNRIHTAQQRAALAVNRELVLLYWQIGQDILARQAARLASSCELGMASHLTHPPVQVLLQVSPGLEGVARHGVALDVAHAAFVLALGVGTVGGAGHGPESPVMCQCPEPIIEDHLSAGCVVVLHQRPGVIDQDLPGNTPEVLQRRLDPAKSGRLVLVREGLHEDAPTMAQCGDN